MDKQALIAILKAKGLDIAEEALKDALEALFQVAEEVVKKSENKYDDLLLVILPQIKPYILEAVDKIDGQQG